MSVQAGNERDGRVEFAEEERDLQRLRAERAERERDEISDSLEKADRERKSLRLRLQEFEIDG